MNILENRSYGKHSWITKSAFLLQNLRYENTEVDFISFMMLIYAWWKGEKVDKKIRTANKFDKILTNDVIFYT